MAGLAARVGILGMLAAILIGPFFSLPEYQSVKHTTSDLGAQSMPYAWIMNAGFVIYGAGVSIAALLTVRITKQTSALLIAFGAGLIGAGLYSGLPIRADMGGSVSEDMLHSLFASLIGFAFASAAASRLLLPQRNLKDGLSWLGLVASLALPMAMASYPDVAGALQRLMFAISFVWLWRQFPVTRLSADIPV